MLIKRNSGYYNCKENKIISLAVIYNNTNNMGCCQTSLIGPDFQPSPAGSIHIQEKMPDHIKNLISVPVNFTLSNEPQPTLTPYFGTKQFKFENNSEVKS